MTSRRRLPMVLGFLGLALIATVLIAMWLMHLEREHQAAERGFIADKAATVVERSGDAPYAGMNALRAFLDGDARPTPERFTSFARATRADSGLTAVAFLALEPGTDPPDFRTVLNAGSPDPVATEGRVRSDPGWRSALEYALRTGRTGLPPVLVTPANPNELHFLTPVYTGGGVPPTETQRRARIRGLLVGHLSLTGNVSPLTAALPPHTAVQVLDGDVVLSGVRHPGTPTVRALDGGGRPLTLLVWAPAQHNPLWTGLMVMAMGLALTGAGGRMLLQSMRRDRYAQQHVDSAMAARDLAEAGLRDSEHRFRALVQDAPTGIFELAADGSLVFANAAWCEMSGLPLERALGRGWVEAIHPEDLAQLAGWESKAAEGRGNQSQFRFLTPTGERHVVNHTGPLTDGDGVVTGWIGTVTDVTQRHLAEERVAGSEQLHRAVVEGAADAIVTGDADGRIVSANPAAERMFGLAAAGLVGQDMARFIPVVLAEDEGRRTQGVRADGSNVPLHITVRRIDAGSERHITVIARDLTAELAAEERVREYAAEQAALREVATVVAAQAPPERVAALAAQRAARVALTDVAVVLRFDQPDGGAGLYADFTRDPLSLPPSVTTIVPDGPVLRRLRDAVGPVRITPAPDEGAVALGDWRVRTAVAAPLLVDGHAWGTLLAGNTGDDTIDPGMESRLTHFASLLSMSISAAEARDQLTVLASTDPLTGLANRRTFQQQLTAEVERAQRHGRRLSLVVMDLDHFKLINDTHGHDVGDRVLVDFTNRLLLEIRRGETLARLGGEEFAWILPEAGADEALLAAERARLAVSDQPFAPTAGWVTASFGVCDLAVAGGAEALFRHADTALYRAKAAGRNRTIVFDGLHPHPPAAAAHGAVGGTHPLD